MVKHNYSVAIKSGNFPSNSTCNVAVAEILCLAKCQQIAADSTKHFSAIPWTKTAWYLLLDLGHTQIVFSLVVGGRYGLHLSWISRHYFQNFANVPLKNMILSGVLFFLDLYIVLHKGLGNFLSTSCNRSR